MLKQLCLLIFVLTFAGSLYGQHILDGRWVGIVTQNEGGYREKYDIIMELKVEGTRVTGRSYCWVDEIYVDMSIEGELLEGKFLKIEDLKILDSKVVDNLQWCMKDYQLIYKKTTDALDGFWQGVTAFGPCIPGKVHLRRQKAKT